MFGFMQFQVARGKDHMNVIWISAKGEQEYSRVINPRSNPHLPPPPHWEDWREDASASPTDPTNPANPNPLLKAGPEATRRPRTVPRKAPLVKGLLRRLHGLVLRDPMAYWQDTSDTAPREV